MEGRGFMDRRDYPAAVRAFTRGAALVEGLPAGARLSRELADLLRLTDRLEEVGRLHRLVDRLRFAEAAANGPAPAAREVERHCRASGSRAGRCSSGRERRSTPSSTSSSATTCSTWPSSGRTCERRWRPTRRRPARVTGRASSCSMRPRRCSARATSCTGRGRRTPWPWASRAWPTTTPAGHRGCHPGRPGNTTPSAASCSLPASSRKPRRPSSEPSTSGPRTCGRISIRGSALPPRPLPGCRQRLPGLRGPGPRPCRVLLQPRAGPRRPGPRPGGIGRLSPSGLTRPDARHSPPRSRRCPSSGGPFESSHAAMTGRDR